MKILIVDDESAIRDSLGLILRYEHHEVLTAGEGRAALALVEQHPDIDLIFLDIKMPGRDGLEVLGDILAGAARRRRRRDLGPRDVRDRGRGHEEGRVRLHREAARPRGRSC